MPGARRRVAQGEGERQAAVGDEREGVSRRAGQRLGGEEWEHLLAEPAAQELLRRGVELPETRDAHARGRELPGAERVEPDRKSTRLNSSHSQISYAVF